MKIKILSLFLCLSAVFSAMAADADAAKEMTEGQEKEKKASWLSAASAYAEAEVQADNPDIKAEALKAQARCYRKAEKYGSEFDALQSLVKGHLPRIDFAATVERQYEIGDIFHKGHRDSFVSWLPFLKKDDRTAEIYRTALENAPASPKAPDTRMKLGRLYIEDQKPELALDVFSDIVKLHPDSKEARFAALELASVFAQMAKRGDGDGEHAKKAIEALDIFIAKYPADNEVDWAKRTRSQVRTYVAERLRKLGEYYIEKQKPEIAKRYLAEVISDFTDTEECPKAEKILASIDKDFAASGKEWTPEQRKFKVSTLPDEPRPIMTLPDDSEGKWLAPVRDLRSGVPLEPENKQNSEVEK